MHSHGFRGLSVFPCVLSRVLMPSNVLSVRQLHAAWRIFFPDRPVSLTPKDEGKKRLRMILVADRCGMSNDSLANMKSAIVGAVSDFVDLEGEDLVEVNISMDPDLGTIYSVALPVKRVKPVLRPGMDAEEADADGISFQWDASNYDSDPASQVGQRVAFDVVRVDLHPGPFL